MLPIIKRELKANLKGFIIWTLVIVAIVLMMLVSYVSMKDDMANLNSVMASMPKALLKAFGMDNLDMTSIEGFYASKGHLSVILIGSVYACNLASSLLVKEYDQKTSEYLLSKPISRSEVYLGKAISFLILITLFNIVIGGTVAIGIYSFASGSAVNSKVVFLLALSPYLLQLAFGYICYFLSIFCTKTRASIGISLGVVFGFYLLYVVGNLADTFSFLKDYNFYSYVDTTALVVNKSLNLSHILAMALTALISLFAGKFVYDRRDF